MIVSVLLIAAAIPVVAVGVEAVLLRRDKRGRPPLGKLVDVGGHRLHARILSAGPSSEDRPLVVLEAGEGERDVTPVATPGVHRHLQRGGRAFAPCTGDANPIRAFLGEAHGVEPGGDIGPEIAGRTDLVQEL